MPRHRWQIPFNLAIGSIPKSQWSRIESITSLLGTLSVPTYDYYPWDISCDPTFSHNKSKLTLSPKYVPPFMYLCISSKCLGHIEFNLYYRSKGTLRLKTSPIRDDQDKSDYTPSYLHTTLHNNNNNNTNNLPPRLCIFTSVKLIARL